MPILLTPTGKLGGLHLSGGELKVNIQQVLHFPTVSSIASWCRLAFTITVWKNKTQVPVDFMRRCLRADRFTAALSALNTVESFFRHLHKPTHLLTRSKTAVAVSSSGLFRASTLFLISFFNTDTAMRYKTEP